MMFLAGDVGGTKTNLAIYSFDGTILEGQKSASFPSGQYASLAEIVRQFLAEGPQGVRHACFGVAGPVKDGRVHVTNLPWIVDAAELQSGLNFQHVSLLNDLEANAYGITTLQPSELLPLNPKAGSLPHGNRALISAGTGLGEAGLVWDGITHRPFASEGGHSDYAPCDETGEALLAFLRQEHRHVSWERVLSGMGMRNTYAFFRARSGIPEPAWLAAEIALHDLAAVVTRAGLEEKDGVCVEALDYFTLNYGAEAGNLALKMLSLGGIYIGGGIAPKMLPKMQSVHFLNGFTQKGRLSNLLIEMPVYVILNSQTALQGAAWYAAHRI